MSVTDRVTSLSRTAQRAIAVLLVPVAIALVWVVVVGSIQLVVTSQATWRTSARTELARARGQASMLKALGQRASALPSAAIWDRLYVAGADGGVGNVVQQDVTRLCSSAGIESQAISLLPAERAGPLTRHAVRLSITGTADRFEKFFAQLRAHPRYLRVESLNVTAPQRQIGDENPTLTVTLEIVGFEGERPAARGASRV